MKTYLFFDTEQATSKGGTSIICEFGYVITDERFEVLERDNLIIDPKISKNEWDWFVVKNLLTRHIFDYEKQPSFDNFYYKIRELIKKADYIFGHSLASDAKAVNDDCKRYSLKSIDYDFWDIKDFYKRFSNTKKNVGLVDILKQLNIKGEEKIHDAETDAFNSMLELKSMLETLNLPLEELLELCPEVKDNTTNYEINSYLLQIKKRDEKNRNYLNCKDENGIKKGTVNWKNYIKFLDEVKPQTNLGSKFANKKVSISINYEEHHFTQILNLIQLIVNEGGTFVLKASTSDIFVNYDEVNEDGSLRSDSRFRHVTEAINNGANIKIIQFSDFLTTLNVTEEKLNNMPIPTYNFLLNKNCNALKEEKTYRENERVVYTSKESTTLGDLFNDKFKEIEEKINN